MSTFRSPLVRIAITLALLGLLCLSVLFIKNIVTTAWQNQEQDIALYKRSPNCLPNKDPSQVDASLPPCQVTTRTVIAKPENTVVDHYRGRDYPKTHRLLTLQDANGQSQTVGDIYEDMWNSIRVGDQVSVTIWRNQVQKVSANGYSSPSYDAKSWNKAESALWPWVIVGLLCSSVIIFLWTPGHGRMRSSPLLL